MVTPVTHIAAPGQGGTWPPGPWPPEQLAICHQAPSISAVVSVSWLQQSRISRKGKQFQGLLIMKRSDESSRIIEFILDDRSKIWD